MADSSPAIGIDLGTTYSCAAIIENDQVKVIHGDDGLRIMASCVYFNENGEKVVGNNAKEQSVQTKNPQNAIFGVKRFIGRTYQEFKTQKNNILFPYKIENIDNRPKICVTYKNEKKTFAAEEVSAMVLTKLIERAEETLRKKITKAVITVPAHFNGSQRQATINAGKIAKLDVLRIINEPTAAAMAYELDNKYENNCNILVYDFGGGTFDVSIVSINKGALDVKATNGEAYLGGDDIDQRITEYFIKEFQRRHNVDLTTKTSNSADSKAIRRLKQKAEQAKINLSQSHSYNLSLDYLYNDLDFEVTLTRLQLEQLNMDLFTKTMECVEKTLKESKLSKNDIDEIVLVGGTTRIPYVRNLVTKYFNNKEINATIHPDESVAIGAARQAAILNGQSNKVACIELSDVCSLSLGIETEGGLMSVILPRNMKIPAKRTREFVTASDLQTIVDIMIFEGERKMTKNNRKLDQFVLSGIKPAPRGLVKIDVTFSIDEDGILHASGVERHGKIKNNLSVAILGNQLSEMEIKRMIKQAEEFKEEDEKQKQRVLKKIELQNDCYDAIKLVDESVDIEDNDKAILKNICEETLQFVNMKNLTQEEIESKIRFISSTFRNIKI